MAFLGTGSGFRMHRLPAALLLLLGLSSAVSIAAAQVQRPGNNRLAQSVTIRGVVLSSADQKPIPGATATLMMERRQTATDDQGRFLFTNVPSSLQGGGVSVTKPGYYCTAMAGFAMPACDQRITIGPAELNFTFTLVPFAAITVHLADQKGDPVINVHAFLFARAVEDGRYVWKPAGLNGKKVADGAFRFESMIPGSWLLATEAYAVDEYYYGNLSYPATWYPGVARRQDAQPILLRPGQEQDLHLTVPRKPVRLVNIPWSWSIPDEPGGYAYGVTAGDMQAQVALSPSNTSHLFQMFASDGTYTFTLCISPSSNQNAGHWSNGTSQAFCGFEEFTIDDHTINVSTVQLQQQVTIPVHVRAEWTQPPQQPQPRYRDGTIVPLTARIALSAAWNRPVGSVVWVSSRHEALNIPNLQSGTYLVRASADQGIYFAYLTCGATNLLRDPLVVGGGHPPCSIEAVLRDDLGSLTLGLTPEAFARMKASGVQISTVTLIPIDDRTRRPSSTAIYSGSPSVSLQVSPGTYLAFVSDGRDLAWREPEVLAHLKTLGKTVTLASGQQTTLLLDWSADLNNPKLREPAPRLGTFQP